MDLSSRARLLYSLYISTAQSLLHQPSTLSIQSIEKAEEIGPLNKKNFGADSERLAGGLKLSGSTE